jgi:site-specific recombinase XerD
VIAILRHACAYAVANRWYDTRALQAYLGHRNIQQTVRYTELSPTWFKNLRMSVSRSVRGKGNER